MKRTLLLALLILATSFNPTGVRANELEQLDSAIRLIPEDAAFYGSLLRNRQQYEMVVGSRAFGRICAMPIVTQCATVVQSPLVRLAWQLYLSQDAEPGSTRARLQRIDTLARTPQARNLALLLGDMLSSEVFVYGDASSIRPLGLPGVVVGFKLTDRRRAELEVGKLQLAATFAWFVNPSLNGRLKNVKIGDHYFLVLSLDGSMVDWQQVPLEWTEWLGADRTKIDRLVARLAAMRLVLAVGLRDDYLLLSIGPSTDALAQLGQGRRLIDRPELKPLAAFADRPMRAIHYMGGLAGRNLLAFSFITDEGIECYLHNGPTNRPDATSPFTVQSMDVSFALDWPAMVDAATPRILRISERIVGTCLGIDDYELPQLATDQLHTMLDVSKVLRRLTVKGHVENGESVLHLIWAIRDVR